MPWTGSRIISTDCCVIVSGSVQQNCATNTEFGDVKNHPSSDEKYVNRQTRKIENFLCSSAPDTHRTNHQKVIREEAVTREQIPPLFPILTAATVMKGAATNSLHPSSRGKLSTFAMLSRL